MKTIVIVLAVVLLGASPVWADVDPFKISVTTTESATAIGATKGYVLINDGSDDVCFDCDQDAPDTASGCLKPGDGAFNAGDTCLVLRVKCPSSTATLRGWALK